MTGRLWPFPDRDGETGPVTRLWRKTGEQHRNAAINLRNLIMPADGGRSGGGQERVNLHEDPASPQGQPGWGYRSPATESAVPAGPATAHCPLSGPAGNSGTTVHRTPNAGIILIKPPAQRRMGVKRGLVDQGLWFNAGVIVAPARFLGSKTLFICGTGTG